jgi:hypothetical protein
MGFYQRWIVPRLIDLAMRNQSLDAYHQRTIRAASGFVLEIGVGSGLNLPLHGSAVDHVWAIDPSAELLRFAANRIADVPVRYRWLEVRRSNSRSRTRSLTPSCQGHLRIFGEPARLPRRLATPLPNPLISNGAV